MSDELWRALYDQFKTRAPAMPSVHDDQPELDRPASCDCPDCGRELDAEGYCGWCEPDPGAA